MLAKSEFTGVTRFTDIQIQKGIVRLLLIKKGLTPFQLETLNVSLLTSGGNQMKVISKSKIKDIALISQYGNGYLFQEVTGTSDFSSAYIIELGVEAGIDLSDNNYLSVDLENLDASCAYEVYGIEHPVLLSAYISYNTTVISGVESQTKQYSLTSDSYGLAIKNNDAIESVRLKYDNGREVTYKTEELRAIMREINDTTLSGDKVESNGVTNQTVQGGGADMFYLHNANIDVPRFHSFEITTKGGTDLTFITLNINQF